MINLTQRWTQLWPFSKITTISLIFKNGRRALPLVVRLPCLDKVKASINYDIQRLHANIK